ncbi:hypothetical protein [Amycolatopsis sp. NPDC051071]|uniref:hypothetical protein n=1 Tax=Amycolatopsis sp. NPDC051071 TaxID=3154637 RepID=UPI003415C2BE
MELLDLIANKHYDKTRRLLIEELERGTPREDLYQELLDLMRDLREEGREAEEEEVAEVADLMTDWALPQFRV